MKHLNASGRWPSGNVRYYYRPKGKKGVPLPDLPTEDPVFLAAYLDAAGKRPAPKAETGTIAAGCIACIASDAYLGLATSTRQVWRRAVEDIRWRYGRGGLADLQPKHIRQDLMRLSPHPANNRLKVWRSLGRWWVDSGLLDDDPAATVRRRAVPKSDGHAAWTREDFARFRAHWPIGSQERLAFELMHQTCAAIGDMTRLGPANVSEGWLSYKGRAAIFKENGASADQRMAILGHETEAEASHYAKSADLRRIVWGTEKFQLAMQVPTRIGKPK